MPRLLGAFLAASLLPMAAMSLQPSTPEVAVPAIAEGLLAGCGDVPEVASLVERLTIREDRIAKALAELDNRKAEISAARLALGTELRRLKAATTGRSGSQTSREQAVDDDIMRLVTVYEVMKPKDAAAVLGALPPEYAAELLIRVNPEAGARIIAAIDPEQAAILTTFMGARSAASK